MSSDPIIRQAFAADSGDACPMGSVAGTIGWHLTAPPDIDVQGTVVDHPLPKDTNPACTEDHRHTVVTFTLYVQNTAVLTKTERADNAEQPFAFLAGAAQPFDTVVVQVCRASRQQAPPYDYCGAIKKYHRPA
jgi:hypothetical protein